MVIGSTEPLSLKQNEDGSSMSVKFPPRVDLKLMNDFEFLEENAKKEERTMKEKQEELIERLERLDAHWFYSPLINHFRKSSCLRLPIQDSFSLYFREIVFQRLDHFIWAVQEVKKSLQYYTSCEFIE